MSHAPYYSDNGCAHSKDGHKTSLFFCFLLLRVSLNHKLFDSGYLLLERIMQNAD